MTGLEMIAQERKEQIEKHGYTVSHDVEENTESEFLFAIMMVVSNLSFMRSPLGKMPEEAYPDLKPESWSNRACKKMLAKDVLGQLAVIGAFAAAEIDRLNHA